MNATLASLPIKVNGIPMGQSSIDLVTWDLNRKGSFSVKSYYVKVASLPSSHLPPHLEICFPWKLLWKGPS